MITWILLACGAPTNSHVEASAAPAAIQASPEVKKPASTPSRDTEKPTAPMKLERTSTERGSTLQLVFDAPGEGVVVRVWGASGLQVSEDVQADLGQVKQGTHHTIEIPHTGAGDLAVEIAGTWSGVRGSDVRSFTVGNRQPTTVPTRQSEGRKVKGWDATRR